MEPDPALLGRAVLLGGEQAPDALLEVLRRLLADTAALDVVLRLADYRQLELRPFTAPGGIRRLLRPVRIGEGPAGGAFSEQRPHDERVPAGVLLHCPVTVRGQRMGVLSVSFPAAPSHRDRRVAVTLAVAAGYLLLEAGHGTDVFDVERRHARLSVAAEMQWQLLPARAYRTPHFEVAGHLEPAVHVGGDAFDFSVTGAALQLAVVDVAGESQAASLAATLAVTALRNARRAGLPPGEQAALAGAAVWQEYRGERSVPALLLRLDTATGQALAVDANSPALFRLRDRHAQRLPLQPQLPLGLFPDVDYQEQVVQANVGDRLMVLTDGALAIPDEDRPLLARLRDTQPLPPAEAVRQVVAGLLTRQPELEDDATVVCIDWRTPTSTPDES